MVSFVMGNTLVPGSRPLQDLVLRDDTTCHQPRFACKLVHDIQTAIGSYPDHLITSLEHAILNVLDVVQDDGSILRHALIDTSDNPPPHLSVLALLNLCVRPSSSSVLAFENNLREQMASTPVGSSLHLV